MKKIQVQGVHHTTIVGSTRQSAIDFWEGVLGMPFVLEQPNLGKPDENHLYFDPGDGRLLTVFTHQERQDARRPAPRIPFSATKRGIGSRTRAHCFATPPRATCPLRSSRRSDCGCYPPCSSAGLRGSCRGRSAARPCRRFSIRAGEATVSVGRARSDQPFEQLHVDRLASGTVRRSGRRIRVDLVLTKIGAAGVETVPAFNAESDGPEGLFRAAGDLGGRLRRELGLEAAPASEGSVPETRSIDAER